MDKIFFLTVATHGTFPVALTSARHAFVMLKSSSTLRQNIQKEENTLRKLFRRTGEAKGLSIILYTFCLGMAEAPVLQLATDASTIASILF